MNRRRLFLGLLLVIAAWLALFADKTPTDPPAGDVVQPLAVRRGAGPATPPAAGRRPGSSEAAADPATLEVAALIPRDELIPVPTDKAKGRDLFPSSNWTPPPPKPEKPLKPPPPMAPPLPFVYLGKKYQAGQWEVYLGRGEELFIVRQGMTLAGVYRVQEIMPPALTLIYLPLKQSQTISIGGS
ncbi:MAG: hypothetical protein V5B33_00185 [Candidatus Accumulibacter sp. UW20]|jgi:hypothetical protein